MSLESPGLLLSVCLIVKDEEEMLGACLESVAGIADEIVVYDTGSTDRTVEIARDAGAKVIEGYWDDDFARARNSALEHASGEWVLTLDADETFLCDPEPLRSLLADHRVNVEAYLIAIQNLQGAGAAEFVHSAVRVARRTAAVWRSRLHEQMVAADDPARALRMGFLSGTRIIHRGYLAEVLTSKNKAERNIATSKAALDDGGSEDPYALLNYARSLMMGERHEEAMEFLEKVATLTELPFVRRMAALTQITILNNLQRYDEALEQVVELRRFSSSQIVADINEAQIRIAMGESELGLAILARVPNRGHDDEAMEHSAHMLAATRGGALAGLGRYSEAADVILDAVRSDGVLEVNLGELVSWLRKAGRDPSEIAQALEVADLVPILGLVLRLQASDADTVLEGAYARFPERLEVLAAAASVAPHLAVERALIWSSRLRQRGLASACPLVVIANDTALDPRVRILACAAAFGSFGERAVVSAVHEARGRLDPQQFDESTAQIARMAPGLLEAEHVDVTLISVPQESAREIPAQRGRAPRVRTSLAAVRATALRGGVNLLSNFRSTSLEGEIARTIARALISSGFPVSTTDYSPSGETGPLEWAHRDAGDFPYFSTLLVLTPEELGNYVLDQGPSLFENRYSIGVWRSELDFPATTMESSAPLLSEIWAPSKFAHDVIARVTDRSVVKTVLPVGAPQPSVQRDTDSTGMVFLASIDYAAGFHRQNPMGAVRAYCLAFGPREGHRLVIETAHAARYPLEHEILMNAVADRPDIEILESGRGASGLIVNDWSDERACFVSLHRSEGTGLALVRAMNARVASIVTAHSCGAELLGERDSFQVPFTLEEMPISETYGVAGRSWAQPDVEQAASAMRIMAEDAQTLRLKARRAHERAKRSLSSVQSVRAIRNRILAIEKQLDVVALGR
ncbi:MAG: glycosyltransferase [Acidimicrobiales bacterium]